MDTANDEALARALQQAQLPQAFAGADYGGGDYYPEPAEDDSDDSDYGGGAKKRKKGGGRGGGRGRGRGRGQASGTPPAPLAAPGSLPMIKPEQALGLLPGMLPPAVPPVADGTGPSDGDDGDSDGRTGSGRRRRRDVGKQRAAGRAWTVEEETLFIRAMETFGRDWKKGAELVGTRDHRAIASHAQKYFIKLCLAGKPLPPAVARTGLGYTLSGSPLDPYSAAARSYGFRPELLTRLTPEELNQARSGLDLDRLPIMYGGRLPNEMAPAPPPPRSSSAAGLDDRKKNRGGAGGRKRIRKAGGGSSDGDDDGPGGDATDPAAAATAAALAAVQAAGLAGLTPQLQAQMAATLAAAAAQAQLASLAGNPAAAGLGVNPFSFTAMLSGADPNALGGLGAAGLGAPQLAGLTGANAGGLAGLTNALAAASAAAAAAAGTPGATLPLGGLLPGMAGLSGALGTGAGGLPGLPGPGALPGPDSTGVLQGTGLGGLSAAPAAPLLVPPPAPPPPQQTEYARNRPRRELAGQRAQMGNTSESLQLVKPQAFMGLPGSGAPLAQPFTVDMSSWALLAMDFHAHLSSYEVIGLLGGTWNPDTRQLVVIEAYACRRAEGSDAATSVELDPAAQVEVQHLMEQKGQKCVGWYHSHPVFEPSPSQKDMDNQRNYQALFRCEKTKLEPFLGIIVGPYDVNMPHPLSVITAFVVQQHKGNMTPFFVNYQLHGVEVVPDNHVVGKLVSMLDLFRDDPGRTDFAEVWRNFSYMQDNGTPDGPALTKLAKFRASLTNYMRDADTTAVRALLDMLCGEVQQRWGVALDGGVALPGTAEGDAAAAAAAAAGGGSMTADLAAAMAAHNAAAGGDAGGNSMLGLLLGEPADPAAAGGLTAEQQAQQQQQLQQHHQQQQQQQQQQADAAASAASAADAMAALLPVLQAAAAAAGTGGMPNPAAGGGMLAALMADDDGPGGLGLPNGNAQAAMNGAAAGAAPPLAVAPLDASLHAAPGGLGVLGQEHAGLLQQPQLTEQQIQQFHQAMLQQQLGQQQQQQQQLGQQLTLPPEMAGMDLAAAMAAAAAAVAGAQQQQGLLQQLKAEPEHMQPGQQAAVGGLGADSGGMAASDVGAVAAGGAADGSPAGVVEGIKQEPAGGQGQGQPAG